MPNTVNTKKNITIALNNAIKALRDMIEPVDIANGYLDELREIDQSKLTEDSQERLNRVDEFYIQLPVWSVIEDEIERLEDVLKEINSSPVSATTAMLEELTEESSDLKEI